MKKFKIFVNDFNMGVFEAESEDAALDAYAREAGYPSFADLADMHKQLEPDEEYRYVYEAVEAEATASDKKQGEDTQMKKYQVFADDFFVGIFEGEDEVAALEAYAQEAGYESLENMNEHLGAEKVDELDVVEVEA